MSSRSRSSRGEGERTAPLTGLATPFVLGILPGIPIGAALFPGSVRQLVLAAFLAILLGAFRRGTLPALLAGLLAGAAAGHGRLAGARSEAIGSLPPLPAVVRAEVEVSGWPVREPDGSIRFEATLRRAEAALGDERVPKEPCRTVVRIGGRSADRSDPVRGERWSLLGTLTERDGERAPGGSPFTISVKSSALAARLSAPVGLPGALARANAAARRALLRMAAGDCRLEPATELASALWLGRQEDVAPEIRASWRRAGISHVLSVSGLHVALLVAGVAWVGRLLGLRRRTRLALGCAAALAFVPFAGGAPPLVRAAGVSLLFLAAAALERPASPVPLLAATAAAELLVRPEHLFDVGFELSYLAAAGLAVLQPPIVRRLGALPRGVASAAGMTLAAQIATAPVALLRFGSLPLVSVFSNLLLVLPVMIVAGAVAVAALVEAAVPGAGTALLPPLALLLEWIDRAALAAASLPGAILRPAPPERVLLVAAGAGALLVPFLPSKLRIAASLLLAAAAVAAILSPPRRVAAGELRIAMLDVGQGDAVLVRARGGEILVDGGGQIRGSGSSFAERRLYRPLAALGVRRIEVVALSHPHPDHCGGLVGVLADLDVGLLLLPPVPDAAGCLAALRTIAAQRRVPVVAARAGTVIRAGDLRIRVLGPSAELARRTTKRDGSNDRSLVLRVDAAGRSALLPGDAERAGEAAVLEAGPEPVDFLKVAHHGSRTSSGAELLLRLRPRIAGLSCGRRNQFGHPAPEVVGRFRKLGIPLVRTDLRGSVEIALRWKGPTSFREIAD